MISTIIPAKNTPVTLSMRFLVALGIESIRVSILQIFQEECLPKVGVINPEPVPSGVYHTKCECHVQTQVFHICTLFDEICIIILQDCLIFQQSNAELELLFIRILLCIDNIIFQSFVVHLVPNTLILIFLCRWSKRYLFFKKFKDRSYWLQTRLGMCLHVSCVGMGQPESACPRPSGRDFTALLWNLSWNGHGYTTLFYYSKFSLGPTCRV